MARQRDFKAEYRRRIERGLAQGLTRSQARGHPKPSEARVRASDASHPKDAKLDAAVRLMNTGSSLTAAAKDARVSPERLRRFIQSKGLATRQGNRWVMSDNRPRRVPILVGSDIRAIVVPNFAEASRAGSYFNAVGRFIESGDLDELAPFEGEGVTDIRGRFFPFPTDPNAIFRYAAKDEPAFHEIYQIVST